MATQTMTSLSLESKTYYDRRLLDWVRHTAVYEQAGQKRGIPKGGGINVEFRRFTPLAAATTALTEGTNPAGSDLSLTAVYATINQYGDFIKGSDIVETQTVDPLLDEITELQGDQAQKTRDVLCREELAGGTNVIYANLAGSRGDVGSGDWFTLTTLRRGERLLARNSGKPVSGSRFMCFMHVDTMTDFMGDSTVQQILQYAGARGGENPLFNGMVAEISRSLLVETPNGKVFAGAGEGSRDVYAAILVAANAYGVLKLDAHGLTTTWVPAVADHGDALGLTWIKGWKMTFAVKRLVENWLVRLEHATTYTG